MWCANPFRDSSLLSYLEWGSLFLPCDPTRSYNILGTGMAYPHFLELPWWRQCVPDGAIFKWKVIHDNNCKYDGINLFFAKLLHILYLILASSKLGKARERTRWNSSNHGSLETQGVLPATQLHFLSSFLVFTCLLGISMWLFNRHFRIKWPTHNFDFLTCPCLVFSFSQWTVSPCGQLSKPKSLTFTLPSFFLLPCQTYPQVPFTVFYLQLLVSLHPVPWARPALSLSYCNSCTTGLSVSVLASLQGFSLQHSICGSQA